MKRVPESIESIGNEIAIRWDDDSETFYPGSFLRAKSPSAETAGERDLLGQVIAGGAGGRDFSDVTVKGWSVVGGYAVKFKFSDGHETGLYTFDYLLEIAGES